MVKERAGRELKSWWRRGLEERWSHSGGEGWKRTEVMVEERAGREVESWRRIGEKKAEVMVEERA